MPRPTAAVVEAEQAVGVDVRPAARRALLHPPNRTITWSLIYLGITASLIGVLGVVGPASPRRLSASSAQGLRGHRPAARRRRGARDPALNNYGQLVPRRRTIESGLILLGIFLAILSAVGLTRGLVARVDDRTSLELSNLITLLSVAIVVAFLAGISYASVAISAQTQLQEDLPEEVRGRVFGVLNMLISTASFVPVDHRRPVADIVGTPSVLLGVAILLTGVGVLSVVMRGTSEAPHVGPPAPAEPFPLTPNSPHSPSTPPAGRSASHAEELRSTAVPDAPRGD